MKTVAIGAATAVWAILTIAASTISPEYIRSYATFWTGAVMLLSLVLTVSFIVFSKPTRDPLTGKRTWLIEWWWVLMMISGFLIVFLQAFIFRLIVPWPDPTPGQILQQRFSAWASSTAFLMQLTTSTVWLRQQIRARQRSEI